MAFLELHGVVKTFGGTIVVDSFDLDVSQGEFVSLLGGSGCGKTTTLRMIAGFETPSGGTISIDGVDVVAAPPNRRSVGMVFQHYALFPNMTAGQNVGFGLKVARRSAEEIRGRVKEMFRLIGMEGMEGRYPSQLSGGQQQRVALARALAARPRVLLLDEPLSALDAAIRARLREEIRAIQRSLGITTIYVTHDQEEALSMSDRVVVMREGRIAQVGTPLEIYNRPATPFVASFVGSLNVVPAQVVDAEAGTLSVAGQVIAGKLPAEAGRCGEVMISLRPELISISNGHPDFNQLTGTVTNVVFLGPTVRLFLRVGDSDLFLDMFNNPRLSLPALGESITVSFPRDACLTSCREDA
ncbi:MAG TPA: ABC transporter ATP-binding protein [Spirochaetia bacterium]|nr:ABC transporter ATP-binding protein [Spirochaetia bacterium]